MTERNLDFDRIINRKNTDCLKLRSKTRYASRRAAAVGGGHGL